MAKKSKFDMAKFLGEQAIKQDKVDEIMNGVELPEKCLVALDKKMILETYDAERKNEKNREVTHPAKEELKGGWSE